MAIHLYRRRLGRLSALLYHPQWFGTTPTRSFTTGRIRLLERSRLLKFPTPGCQHRNPNSDSTDWTSCPIGSATRRLTRALRQELSARYPPLTVAICDREKLHSSQGVPDRLPTVRASATLDHMPHELLRRAIEQSKGWDDPLLRAMVLLHGARVLAVVDKGAARRAFADGLVMVESISLPARHLDLILNEAVRLGIAADPVGAVALFHRLPEAKARFGVAQPGGR